MAHEMIETGVNSKCSLQVVFILIVLILIVLTLVGIELVDIEPVNLELVVLVIVVPIGNAEVDVAFPAAYQTMGTAHQPAVGSSQGPSSSLLLSPSGISPWARYHPRRMDLACGAV
jgi:purine-cytosine permease-like protein